MCSLTVKEMSQLYYLNREIEHLQRQLEELECLAEGTTQVITGMPHGSGTSDKVGRYAVQIADLRSMIDNRKARCWDELRRLLKHGFTKSSKVEKAKETYRQKSSTTLTWVAENAIGEADILEKSTSEVYFQFKSWCETEGIEKVPKQLNFTEEIKKEFGVVTGIARRDQKTGKVSRFFGKA